MARLRVEGRCADWNTQCRCATHENHRLLEQHSLGERGHRLLAHALTSFRRCCLKVPLRLLARREPNRLAQNPLDLFVSLDLLCHQVAEPRGIDTQKRLGLQHRGKGLNGSASLDGGKRPWNMPDRSLYRFDGCVWVDSMWHEWWARKQMELCRRIGRHLRTLDFNEGSWNDTGARVCEIELSGNHKPNP